MEFLSKMWKPIWTSLSNRSFRKRDPMIGLDIGSQTIKLVQLTSKHGKGQLEFCGVKSLSRPTGEEEGGHADSAIEEVIRELVQEGQLRQRQVACSMRGPSVMVKYLRVPIMSESEFEEHLKWEMDQYIPCDVKDIYWDYHIPKPGHREASEVMMSVLLAAAKKEAVHKRVGLLQRSGLNPVVVDVDHLALSNMYAFNYEGGDPKSILLINLGPSGVGMIVINDGIPVLMREIEVGGDGYRELMEKTVQNSFEEKGTVQVAYHSASPDLLLNEVYREITYEVKKTIEYCCDMVPPPKIQKLFLCGGYARLPGLAKTIETGVNLPIDFIDPLKKLNAHSKVKRRQSMQNFELLGGVAIGLALRGIDTR